MIKDGRSRPLTARLEAARKNRYQQIRKGHLLLLWAIGAEGCEAHLQPLTAGASDFWAASLCVHSPAGQLTFKLTKEDMPDFAHLPRKAKNHWDGHNAAENMERLEKLAKGVHA